MVISMQEAHGGCYHVGIIIHTNAMHTLSWLFPFPCEHLAHGNCVFILLTPLSIPQSNVPVYRQIRSLSLELTTFISLYKSVTSKMFSLGHSDSFGNFLLIFGDCNHWVEQKQLLHLSSLMIFIIIFSIHAELIRIMDTSSLSSKMFQIEFSTLFTTVVNGFHHFGFPYEE